MPRETVVNAQPADMFVVKIGWSPEREVQLGVEIIEGRSMFWQLLEWHLTNAGPTHVQLDGFALNNPTLGSAMRAIVGYAAAATKADPQSGERDEWMGKQLLNLLDTITPMYKGLWSDLDRQGCNNLIRIARRARDQAFGRDE